MELFPVIVFVIKLKGESVIVNSFKEIMLW